MTARMPTLLLALAVSCAGLAGCAHVAPANDPRPVATMTASANTAPTAVPPAREPSPRLAPNETQVARYTTVLNEPQEADTYPLAVVAQVRFPRQVVHTVGEAVRYLLLRTGYQLAPDATLDASVLGVLEMRLPDNQRLLGPYRVDAMLSVLIGPAFRLVSDPATRQVRYLPVASASSAPASTPLPSTSR